jgi:hypothetical protein
MKKLFLLSFLICFVFSSFAVHAVQSVKMEKHKTEKAIFEVVAVSNETVLMPLNADFESVISVHRKQGELDKQSISSFAKHPETSCNDIYPWCRNYDKTNRAVKDTKA